MENILKDLDALSQAKKASSRSLKLSFIFAGIIVILALIWAFSVQLTALGKVVVIDRSGEYIQTKVYEREDLFEALIKNTCALTTSYANSFSATELKINQARTRFYVNKNDADKIFEKYFSDKAYSDAINGGIIYECELEKVTSIEGKNEPYKVCFSSVLKVHSPFGEQKFRILSEGELVGIRPQFPENVTGYFFSSLKQKITRIENGESNEN